MSSSYEKVVKLACKPKAAPPKSKYLDPIVAATWSEDGAVHDVCKALSPRFREPNAVVVFKALIVLHTMIRNGSTDNVLGYLSSSEVLRLRNISAGHWEGYAAPQNLQNYATYLDTRIRAYRDLKHDAIRVQSESNRDLRNSLAIEEGRVEAGEKPSKSTRRRFGGGRKEEEVGSAATSLHQRSKTISGRKLRVMTVEKGLLRETKVVQKMIDVLGECRFYLDDLEDELNITALRMLVKDLLILFQACNEGVINVLEHYFEMSRVDAQEALAIYRHFCKETERVVEFLSVAKKLQNLLNVPIPNLRHAPVSLAGSLEEYLNDPNFEQNRIEYKTQKEAADRAAKSGTKLPAPKPTEKPPSPKPATSKAPTSQASSSASTSTPPKPANQAMIDFFSAIEEEQPQMFNPQTGSPTSNYFQQQAAFNPFSQQQPMMMTGAPFGQPQVQIQPTGMPTNPFGLQPQQSQPPFGGNFLTAQPTAFLQPQSTGAPNPFRQSMLMPTMTGMPSFAGMGVGMQAQPQPTGMPTNPFPLQPQQTSNPFPVQPQQTSNPFPTQQQGQSAPGQNPFPNFSEGNNPFPTQNPGQSQQGSNLFGGQPSQQNNGSNFFGSSPLSAPATSGPSFATPSAPTPSFAPPNAPALATPPRPASAPHRPNAVPDLQPVKSHQTGSRNPFGVPVTPAPPVPKVPTLMELAMGMGGGGGTPGGTNQQQQQQQQQTNQFGGLNSTPTGFNPSPNGQSTAMSSIASSFTFDKPSSPTATSPLRGLDTGATSSTTTGSTFSSSLFSSLSPQATATSTSTSPNGFTPSISISSAGGTQPLQSQPTGFGGIKPFKPSSSFGAALLESLPETPNGIGNSSSLGTSPSATGNPGTNGLSGFGNNPSQPFASSLTTGVGLRPQATGLAGAANPFRASMFPATTNPTGPFGGLGGPSSAFGNSNPFPSSLGTTPTGFMGGVGANNMFGGSAFGAGQDANKGQQQQQQQQQNGHASLI
ncbi:ANTH-domain-containing protein [Cristinia sonorae]|uniref:ANTH-domain-containing protein n=1 Tax=Cristinia sonorae TaxID=1940300 RepID=A0A8K0XSF6_9AGAR|nr:ANTH-domain-containing protein [Cristinia sonorae]